MDMKIFQEIRRQLDQFSKITTLAPSLKKTINQLITGLDGLCLSIEINNELVARLRNLLRTILADNQSEEISMPAAAAATGILLADVAYQAALALAEYSPINETDLITQEDIKPGDNVVYVSTGHQYLCEGLQQWFFTKKDYIDPTTRQQFSNRDQITLCARGLAALPPQATTSATARTTTTTTPTFNTTLPNTIDISVHRLDSIANDYLILSEILQENNNQRIFELLIEQHDSSNLILNEMMPVRPLHSNINQSFIENIISMSNINPFAFFNSTVITTWTKLDINSSSSLIYSSEPRNLPVGAISFQKFNDNLEIMIVSNEIFSGHLDNTISLQADENLYSNPIPNSTDHLIILNISPHSNTLRSLFRAIEAIQGRIPAWMKQEIQRFATYTPTTAPRI